MVAASQIQNLRYIDVSGHFFSGTLPTEGNLSFILWSLNLASNNIRVCLEATTPCLSCLLQA